MAIRLNKVIRDLNVGISTAADFLKKKGFEVEPDPSTKISEEQYDLLAKEFGEKNKANVKKAQGEKSGAKKTDDQKKEVKVKAEKASDEASIEKPNVEAPKPKIVGKIDLSKVSAQKEEKSVVNDESVKQPEAKKEKSLKKEDAKKEEKVNKEESKKQVNTVQKSDKVTLEVKSEELKNAENKVDTKSEIKEKPKSHNIEKDLKTEKVEEKEAEKEEQLFRNSTPEPTVKLSVVGRIDLDSINSSTRPKKKSKEEKKKEREEKEKVRVEQRKIYKDAFIKDLKREENKTSTKQDTKKTDDANAKKKRNRIRGEKVDINNVVNSIAEGQKKQDNKFRSEQGSGSKKNKDRFKKQPVKQEISEEDVAKQVKETLARLTSKGKNKAAKYRKEKREMVSNRIQELEDLEMAESKVLKLTEFVTANELATMMNVSVNQVISTCMSIGMMVSINQRLDAETINIVADEFGFKTEYVSAEVSQAIVEEEDAEEDLLPRAPIVTVMGHVDHGKTSLLDYIRKANVIAGEAGGITQHIGAYNVKLEDGRRITFLDTPGHEAFTAMRARGAKVTDIAIIIVAADDSVMPQTKEAINHAMAANVPIVFAINKVDKPTANPDKIKEELANLNFLVEDWGGKYQSQDISAKSGLGVADLMEKVLLEAELLELKANPNRNATGSVIESSLDKGRGYVSTVLVSNGTLKIGDVVLAGSHYGRVKAMFNERNQRIKESKPSEPALILGLNGAPAAGDTFHVVATDQEAREITNKREQLAREQGLRTQKILTLDELGRRIALGNFQELNIIVKADVDGSVEALSDSLIKLSTEQIQVNVIHKGVGQISESDVSLAAASNAIIVGFQVRPSGGAAKMAEQEGVDIRKYSIIYDAIEEVKSAMEGMLAPELKEQVTATIEVREVYNITKVGIVAGAMVKTGKVKRSDKARLIRDGIVIFTGNINALKRFKDDVKEVGTNFECGISLVSCNDMKVGDVIETFEEIEVKQTL